MNVLKNAVSGSLVVCALQFLSGCTAPAYNYRAEVTEISTPPLNDVVSVQIGEEMMRQGKYYEKDAINLSQDITFGLFRMYTLAPGDYIKTGEDKEAEYYQPGSGLRGGKVTKAALADPWESVQLLKNKNKIGIVTIFHVKVSEEANGVTRVKRPFLADDSFQQTLIYSGKIGTKVKIGYREFSNNMARPAFNNDVEYDLSESKIIGYKGARIEILEATNEFIRYRVIQNFNRAER